MRSSIRSKGDGKSYAPVDVAAFDAAHLGTRLEGNVDCVAVLPGLLRVEADGEMVTFEAPDAPAGSRIAISAGNPSYAQDPVSFGTGRQTIALHEHFGFREDKFVVELFDARGEILDERVIHLPLAYPRLVTKVERTAPAKSAPEGHGRDPGRDVRLQDGRESRRRQSRSSLIRTRPSPAGSRCGASSWTAPR